MRPDQRGAMAAVEAALILPVLLLMVGLTVVLAQDQLAQQAVSSAAAQGARAASVERTPATATTAAHQVVTSTLSEAGIQCSSTSVAVNAAGLTAAIGARAQVSVTVSCQIDFQVGFPGFPASRTLTQTGTSPVDTHRSR